ncbi:MAG: CoB--CoM heterodisulfide reductase iron-sulfur subunit B family protein [bacterium]|jgi:heterodisulfide reductase subunit B
MNYLYFPGCSLKGTGRAYEDSILSVFKGLQLPLEELDDWNCCGATSYMAISEMKAFALSARNLALAQKQAHSRENCGLVTPCAACYLVLIKTQKYLEEFPQIGDKIKAALKAANLDYGGKVRVRHPLDVLANDFGPEKLASFVKKPLKGLKVACYYGCQIVRPYAEFDDQHNPTTMNRIMHALGAQTIDWPLKTRCCGGSLTGTIQEVGMRLSYILLREASRLGADVVATACPLCQFNLECYQKQMSREFEDAISIPVVYFSQLVGYAMGLPEKELGMKRLFVPFEFNPVAEPAKGGVHVGI